MILPATIGDADGLHLRPWRTSDAEALVAAVSQSVEHLRPWLPRIGDEPRTVEQRRTQIRDWEHVLREEDDANLGIFIGTEVVGGLGMHPRIGPGGTELGYWVHVDHVRRGIATRASGLATDLAFSLPVIDRVEIHHDPANIASGRVPPALGYTLVGEHPHESRTPGATGTMLHWRITRPEWAARNS